MAEDVKVRFAGEPEDLLRDIQRIEDRYEELTRRFVELAKQQDFDPTSQDARELRAEIAKLGDELVGAGRKGAGALRDAGDAAQAVADDYIAAIRAVESAKGPEELAALRREAVRLGKEFLRVGGSAQSLAAEVLRTGDATEDEMAQARQAVVTLERAFDEVNENQKTLQRGAKATGNAFSDAFGNAKKAVASLGLALGLRELAQYGQTALQTKADIESMVSAIGAAADSEERAAELAAFAERESRRLGISYLELGRNLAGYEVAARGANIPDAERLDLMRQLLEVLRARQLGEADIASVLVAVNQVASKGVVSMEELRQQIGERVPGALQGLAKQLGVTVPELDKMVSSGKLLSEVGLPALIRGLREEVSDEALQDGLDGLNKKLADTARLGQDIRAAFAEGFAGQVAEGIDEAVDSTETFTKAARFVGQAVGFVLDRVKDNAKAFGDLGEAAGTAFESFRAGNVDLQGVSDALEDNWTWLQPVLQGLIYLDRALVPEKYRSSGNALGDVSDALGRLSTEAGRSQAIVAVSEYLSRVQEEGKGSAEALGIASDAVEAVIASYETAGQEVPASALLIQRSLEDLASGAEGAADATGSAVDRATMVIEAARAKFQAAVAEMRDGLRGAAEDAAREVAVLEETIGGLQGATQTQLEAVEKAVEAAVEAWGIYGEDVPEEIQHVVYFLEQQKTLINEIGEDAREAAAGVTEWLESFDTATSNASQLEDLEKRIQGALDAYELLGEEAPPEIRRVADELGVVSTRMQEVQEEAKKTREKVAEEFEGLVDDLEEAFAKLRDSAAVDTDDSRAELEALRKERDKLLEKTEGGAIGELADLDRLDEIRTAIAKIEAASDGYGDSVKRSRVNIEEVDDAIKSLVESNAAAFGRLGDVQRQQIGNILTQLQGFAQQGIASTGAVANAFGQVADVLESAGVDVEGLRSELEATEGGVFDVRGAFADLGKTAADELAKTVEGWENLDTAQQAQVKGLRTVEEEVRKSLERTTERIEEAAVVWGKAFDVIIAKCEEVERCVSKLASNF